MNVVIALNAQPSSTPPSGQGLSLKQVWGQVADGLSWFFGNLRPAFVWAVVGLTICLAFFIYYWLCLRPRRNSLEWIAMEEERTRSKPMTLTLRHHPVEKKDALPMLVITVVYALTAFFRLGSFEAPQSYTVFAQGDTYGFSYRQAVTVDKVSYFTSLGSGHYTLEWSDDGVNWEGVKLDQSYNTLFKWRVLDLNRIDRDGEEVKGEDEGKAVVGPITAQQFRIVASDAPRQEGLWLAELALWSGDAALMPSQVEDGGRSLFDEGDLWTVKPTYMNSSYFDEIYHPRTALEHLNNVYPYEVSHPPLGKLIISVGIALFGMVPFGWRFMGTLFGVLMVPILYIFLKNLFGKTPVAVCGTCLFTFDFMHLVQTRIATIDTYGVFFVLVSYYFMYRWLTIPAGTKLRKSALPLFLSGLFWGIGCASKWTVVYAGAGLALFWLLGLIFKGREWGRLSLAGRGEMPQQQEGGDPNPFAGTARSGGSQAVPSFSAYVMGTVALSVLFFVVIPVGIYVASYLPYAFAAAAREGGEPVTLRSLVTIVWKNQVFMLTYHRGVHTPHPYESYWYQWIFDGRPILYYRDWDYASTDGIASLFASFNNPLVSWLGLASFWAVLIQTIRRRCGKGLFILIAVLSQFLPWLPIGRILFAYHYFPTILFLVFAISYLMDDILTRRRRGYGLAVYGFTGCAVGLYAVFYPALIGLYTPLWYNRYFLRWFPSWPL